jgi:hypothetical protein
MPNKEESTAQGATDSGLRPGEFPLGSEMSRAAARAMLLTLEACNPGFEMVIRFVEHNGQGGDTIKLWIPGV